ncbi:MAG TPA: threonine/serine exporter family protein [Anaeromyxobacter sp.]|nr:threonine/serine exporter family protein [Anaeromyxobacter sp.]
MNLLLDLLRNAVLAAIPAVGFGMAFNVPVRILGWCALGGALGRALRLLLVTAGLPVAWATLLAAAAVSWLGVWAAQRLRAHPKVFTVAAMIPMVPGVPIYTAILALSEIQRGGLTYELLATAVTAALNAAFIVAALAVGLATPGLFVFRRRPVV